MAFSDDPKMSEHIGTATFGMGCFWCSEASFSEVEGMVSHRVGYMGGTKERPTYEDVCTGETGHTEVVELLFDERTSYGELLDIFWASHNPTHQEEGDLGDQYRSAIFYHGPEQKAQAEGSMRRVLASGRFRGRMRTAIIPASTFWVAEEHHQCYLTKMRGKR
jgi:peptide-methionine (S)-S-oxide reductase